MKLINFGKDQEFIPAVQEATLDELLEIADDFGKVSLGGIWDNQAEIKLNFCDNDYVVIKCRKYSSVKKNLAEAVQKARAYKEFYRSIDI